MQHNNIEFIVCSRGWCYPQWVGNFYPEDMPQEWWLSYYSNEFYAVLIPWEYLCTADIAMVQQWKDDVHTGFKFFVELSIYVPIGRMLQLLEPLAPQLAGIVLREIDQANALKQRYPMNAVINAAVDIAPVVVAKQHVSNNLLTTFERYQLGCYWRPEIDSINECNGLLGIAEITQATKHNPRSLKKIIEHCYSIKGPTTIGLVFGSDAPNIEEMRTAIMINQMLV